MKIKISRSFRRVRQIADFVPVESICEASVEYETPDSDEFLLAEQEDSAARALQAFCERHVEEALMGYKPACISCGAKQIVGGAGLTKEGMCDECTKKIYGLKGRKSN